VLGIESGKFTVVGGQYRGDVESFCQTILAENTAENCVLGRHIQVAENIVKDGQFMSGIKSTSNSLQFM
jgi:hypothetical protein